MFDLATILIAAVILMLTYLYMKARPASGLPPGPKGWPFTGHLNLVYYGKEKQFHVVTANWGKQYNGFYTLQCGHVSCVMLTDLDVTKEALLDNADVWSDRPLNNDFIKMATRGEGGIFFQNGEKCKQIRRLALQSLRDFGVGKQSIEEKIQDELVQVISVIESYKGESFQFGVLFDKASANVICGVLFGNRMSYSDEEYCKLLKEMHLLVASGGMQNIFTFLPWYTFWVIPIFQSAVEMFNAHKFLRTFVGKRIADHRESFDAENIRDFVDLYLKKEQTETNSIYSDKHMFTVLVDLFLAATETTSTSLLWAFLFLIKNPHVQAKCRQQIIQQIGDDRLPSYKDKASLPYVEATVSEVLRLANTTPIFQHHNSAKATTLRGYSLPKDTWMMINSYAIHTNPKYWKDPMTFNPERFLDENGAYKRPEAFFPFGLGKRVCLGESLARMELFIFVAGLLQKFEISTDDASKLPSLENGELGFTLCPAPYSIRMKSIH